MVMQGVAGDRLPAVHLAAAQAACHAPVQRITTVRWAEHVASTIEKVTPSCAQQAFTACSWQDLWG